MAAVGQPRIEGLELDDDAVSRKARGAFFTPPSLAAALCDWALRSGEDWVLEPSCGEAVFLTAAARRLTALRGRPAGAGQLRGFDVHDSSLTRAAAALAALGSTATLTRADFLASPARSDVDAVVGNPPFIRYQTFVGAARATAQRAARAQDVELSGLASSWAAFVVHAAGCLRPGGRLAMVLPGELLNRNYAGAVRDFLLQRFAEVTVIAFGERVFPGVSEEVVLVLAEGSGGCTALCLRPVQDVGELSALRLGGTVGRTWVPSAPGAPWTAALPATGGLDAYDAAVAGPHFTAVSLGLAASRDRHRLEPVLHAERPGRRAVSSRPASHRRG